MSEPKIVKIIDRQDLVRDTRNKAVLAADRSKLNEHREKLRLMRKLLNQGEELEKLKEDVAEIKELLKVIANK